MGWTMRALDRPRLGRAATRYATKGWDVVPGALFAGARFRCDDPGCMTVGCHPASALWQEMATHDPALVETWWRHTPYAVLLPTGRAFDVIEVPACLGLSARGLGTRPPGPIAVAASGRWMFFVRRGDGLRPELACRMDIVLHGRGSWVPAPPTREPVGRARWEVSPVAVDWRLPRSYAVQELLLTALARTTPPQSPAARVWAADAASAHAV